jgi:hypothetical protein
MLEQILAEIRGGGTFETTALAARLQTSPQMIAAMLEHLQRLGIVQPYFRRHDGCGSCNLRDNCDSSDQVLLWQGSEQD